MFEIFIKLKHDWIDICGVTDVELFKALTGWSNGMDEVIKIKNFAFRAEDIVSITINR